MAKPSGLAFATFLVVLAITLFLLGRLAVIALYMAAPAQQDVAIKARMTPDCAVRSHRVAPQIPIEASPMQPIPGDPRAVRHIARASGRSKADISATLQTAITAERTAKQSTDGWAPPCWRCRLRAASG